MKPFGGNLTNISTVTQGNQYQFYEFLFCKTVVLRQSLHYIQVLSQRQRQQGKNRHFVEAKTCQLSRRHEKAAMLDRLVTWFLFMYPKLSLDYPIKCKPGLNHQGFRHDMREAVTIQLLKCSTSSYF